MHSSVRKMWLSCLVASSVVAMATAANEYLPPNKGYNYPPPAVPFPTDNKPTTQPKPYNPVPKPPTPPRNPTYLPPTQPNHDDHHEDHHHHEPGMPFDFSYAVNEDGNDYSHNAISDGDVTRGEYRVALPDGRTQIVKYTADWKNGFNAEVSYEGEAKYPDQPSGPSYGQRPTTGGSGPGQAYVPPSQGGGYQY
ncbi:pro-resilin [Pectinophora gossypiella]|uniref:pro-resilin n=1 Tax=Pectinophora gossypiella TaxID=13191 RepID=UPI00214E9DC9|nr:pro-resilin [Pectinophora gossypiella]